ncbi:MAG: family 10 glycosylhydrolase [Muribaculaceae bacterium]|nr:family 10 glycosylhydrolase [Muribaculaceae bacterium]
MKSRFLRLFTMALLLSTIVGNAFAANPKREMRSTWLTLVENIDWPSTKGTSASAQTKQKQELIAYLDYLEELKMTSTCLHIRTMGDAAYPSEYAPWSSYISGTRGVSPGWDPLAFFVEECHKRGIEAYVWLNPYRWSSKGLTTWSTEKDLEWKNKDMLIVGSNGTYVTFNPALKETRELIVNVIKEIVNNYAIDGMLFDDYFYPSGGTAEDSSAPDYDDYKASGTTMSIGDWRRRNVNDMVADCYNTIKELRPDVRFGIGPAGVSSKSASLYGLPSLSSYGSSASDWQYATIYSDPLTWMKEGTIDFISPQLYWETTHSTNGYEELTHWWSDAADKLNCHYYSSQASYKVTNTGWGVNEMIKQVEHNRTYAKNNNCGTIYYNSNTFKSYLSSLKDNVYSTPALTPEITWKHGDSYGAVSNLKYNNGTLSWDATENGNAIIRYTVYAMPLSVTIDQAKSADGDGFDGKYLQKVVYGTSYTLDSDKQSNYWYVVNVFDGYGKEHELAIANYPEGDSEVATLISPINGAKVAWSQEFKWSNIDNATYTIEIANNEAFTTIVKQEKNLTTNSAIVDLSDLESTKTYYWRIRTAQASKLESVSEVASFVTTTRPSAPKTILLTPNDGAKLEEDVTFSWSAVECEEYTLQMSAQTDFSNILYQKKLTTNSHDLTLSYLGLGKYYWRVITSSKSMTDTYSDVRSFEITKLSVGNFEQGYSIKIDKDNDTYTETNNIALNSVWFRSVHDDYKNITFGNDGAFNRSFCVVGNTVYMAGRSENSSKASIYLRKFDGTTGEILGDIILGDEGKVAYYPCNSVDKDSKGNVCISNLSLNISSTPIKLHLVDLETGELTEVASLTYSGSTSRCDHITLTGDVAEGNFTVYAAFAKAKVVVRWNYENGVQKSQEVCTLTLNPSSKSTLGTAPRIILIDDNSFFIRGGETEWARYNFSSGKVVDSFNNNTALKPIAGEANGGTWFTLNGTNYVALPYADYTDPQGHQFMLMKADEDLSFKSMEEMWTMPKDGMGAMSSTTFQADADYVQTSAGRIMLYLFVPGNGLCAYEIVDTAASGVEDCTFGTSNATEVARYDIHGRMLSHPTNGLNIIKMSDGTVKKVIVK